jgi:hypothetical protein
MRPLMLILAIMLSLTGVTIAQDFAPYAGSSTHCPDEIATLYFKKF